MSVVALGAVNHRHAASAVIGAARSLPSVTAVSPNGRIVILGSGFAPEGDPQQAGQDDLPSKLAGVCVMAGDRRAGVARVASGQIEVVLPTELPAEAAIQVAVNCDEASEARSNVFTSRVQSAAPEFLYLVNNPDGRNPVQAVDADTGRNGGRPGGTVVLTAVGLGVVDADGRVLNPVEVRLGGSLVPAEDVLSVTARQGSPGQYEIRLRIPADTESGDQTITIRAAEFDSPAGGYVTIGTE